MHQTVARVWHFIEQQRMLDPGDRIVLGVSGGADSTAMLHIFHTLTKGLWPNGSICVAHLNHNLRGEESEDDEKFVRGLCAQINVNCFVESADVRQRAADNKEGLEVTARKLRYDFFVRIAKQQCATKIATAHTANDQAETLLLRLIRGSGTSGLGGIQPNRPLHPDDPVSLIRPLLCLTRDQVMEYCEDNLLAYRTDSSNLTMDYSRNRVRNRIIPELVELNPQIIVILAETANRLREDETILQSIALERLSSIALKSDGCLRVPIYILNQLSPLRTRMIREIIRIVAGDLNRITARHLAAIDSLLVDGKSGKTVSLPGISVSREFDELVFAVRARTEGLTTPLKLAADYLHRLDENRQVLIRLNNRELILNLVRTDKYVWEKRSRFTALLDGARLQSPLFVRPRRRGDRYIRVGSENSARVKELMIENRVPLNERINYPVVVTSDDQIVWIPGLPVAAKFAASPDTTAWAVLNASFHDDRRSDKE